MKTTKTKKTKKEEILGIIRVHPEVSLIKTLEK